MSRIFTTAPVRQTIGWERLPLLVQPVRRRLGRLGWFAIGMAIGLALEAFVR